MILFDLVYDLPVVRQAIEFLTSSHPLPVAGLGRPDHISAEAIAKDIVRLNLLKVVDEVDGLGVGHLGEDFPVGVGASDALIVPVRTAVTSLGAAFDDGVCGKVLSIVALPGKNVKDFLNHPVGLTGLGSLEGGVGSGGTGRSSGSNVFHGF